MQDEHNTQFRRTRRRKRKNRRGRRKKQNQQQKLIEDTFGGVHKNELLIFGYISSIQASLRDNKIIPHDIYQLCLSFYKNFVAILWFKFMETTFKFGIFDIDKRENITINTQKLSNDTEYYPRSAACHCTNFKFKENTLN